MPDGGRNLVLVYGFPRGGTSAVAGVLHHAGFCLGRVSAGRSPSPMSRSAYQTFECCDYIATWKRRRVGPDGKSDQYTPGGFPALARYVERRCRDTAARPQAVKRPGLHLWSCSPEWVSLPVVTVGVRRPLEESARSNAQRRPARTLDGWVDHLNTMQASIDVFESQRRPVYVVDFHGLLSDARGVVVDLLAALEPHTGAPGRGGWDVDAAVRFVRPEMSQWGE